MARLLNHETLHQLDLRLDDLHQVITDWGLGDFLEPVRYAGGNRDAEQARASWSGRSERRTDGHKSGFSQLSMRRTAASVVLGVLASCQQAVFGEGGKRVDLP